MNERPCDWIDDYLTGDLSGESRAAFAAHLGDCQDCREAVVEWQSLRTVLREASEELENPGRTLGQRISQNTSSLPAEGRPQTAARRSMVVAAAIFVASVFFAVTSRRAPRVAEVTKAPETETLSVTTLEPPAGIEFADDVIAVPIDVGDLNATVVWVYPTSKQVSSTN